MNFKSECVGVPIYEGDVFKFMSWANTGSGAGYYYNTVIQIAFTSTELSAGYNPSGKVKFNLVRNIYKCKNDMHHTSFYVLFTSETLEDMNEFKNNVNYISEKHDYANTFMTNTAVKGQLPISEYFANIEKYNRTSGTKLNQKTDTNWFGQPIEIEKNGEKQYTFGFWLLDITLSSSGVFPDFSTSGVMMVSENGVPLNTGLLETPLTIIDEDLSQMNKLPNSSEYLRKVATAWANATPYDVDALSRLCKRNTTKTLNEYSFNGNGQVINVVDLYIPEQIDVDYTLNYLHVKSTKEIYAFITTPLAEITPNKIFYKTFNKSNIPQSASIIVPDKNFVLKATPSHFFYEQIDISNTNTITSGKQSYNISEYYNDEILLIVAQNKTMKYVNDENIYNIASEKILLNKISKNYVNNGVVYSNFIKNNTNTKWIECESLEDFNRKIGDQVPIDTTTDTTDIGAGVDIDNTTDIGSNDGVVTDTTKEVTTTSAMYSIYNASENTLQAFGNYLWNVDNDMFQTIINNLKLNGSDPLDAIINCYRLQLSTDVFTDMESNIKIGRNSTDISCPKIVKYKPNHLLSTFNINGLYNDFRDYQTEISIYLPFYGVISLDTSLVMYSNIKIYLTIDLFQGVGKYHIYCNDNLLTTNDVNLAENVLISGTRQSQVANSYMNSVTSLVSSGITMGGSIATGNVYGMLGSGTQMASATEGVLTSEGKGGLNIVSNFSPNINKYLDTNIYIVYGYYAYSIPNNYPTTVGYPYNETNTIRSVKGYVVVENSNLSIENATTNELDLINNLLSNGVFYE